MIERLLVPPPAHVNTELLRAEMPSIAVVSRGWKPRLRADAREWEIGEPDLVALDVELGDAGGDEPVTLALDGAGDVTRAALALLTRVQWAIPPRNPSPLLARLRRRHRELHDLGFALVHADWVHALDTQAWAARLEPSASLAPLTAALFHDVERLVDEKETRLDHLAHDYDAFKRAHAARGARLARAALEGELPDPVLEQVLALIARHETPGSDPDLVLVNDADALSFFSRNCGGFLAWYGEAQARRKVAWTLARMSPRARARLPHIRVPAPIRRMVEDSIGQVERERGNR